MKNSYKLTDDYYIIYINHKGTILECYVDIDDFDLVNSYPLTWTVSSTKSGRVTGVKACYWNYDGTGKQKVISMHRMILSDTPDHQLIDHRDRNPLNNRRYNLRHLSNTENLQSKSAHIDNLSGMAGVQWNESRQRWMVVIYVNGRHIRGGQHVHLIDAKRSCTKLRMVHCPHSVTRTPIKLEKTS